MMISKAALSDMEAILELQYLAYQSEAKLVGSFDIPPLKQTLDEVTEEYENGIMLKAVDHENKIIGSVRGYVDKETLFIGKLIVHPDMQGQGIGTQLLTEIEKLCPQPRYELFTSSKSLKNIKLYERLGYVPCKTKQISPELMLVYMEKLLRDIL